MEYSFHRSKSEEKEEREELAPTTARSLKIGTQTSNGRNSLESDSSQISAGSTHTSQTKRNSKIYRFSSKPSSSETPRNLDELPVSTMECRQRHQSQFSKTYNEVRARTSSHDATPVMGDSKAGATTGSAASAGIYFMSCLADATRVSSELKFETMELTDMYRIGRAYDSGPLRLRYAMTEQIFNELWAGEENMLKMRQSNNKAAQWPGQRLYSQYNSTGAPPEKQRHGAHVSGYGFPGKATYAGQSQYSNQHRYQYEPHGYTLAGRNAPQQPFGSWPPLNSVPSQLQPYRSESYRPQSQRSSSVHQSQQPTFAISPSLPGLSDEWHPAPPSHHSTDQQSPSPLYPANSDGSLPTPPSNNNHIDSYAQTTATSGPIDGYNYPGNPFHSQVPQYAQSPQLGSSRSAQQFDPQISAHGPSRTNVLNRYPQSRPIPASTGPDDPYDYFDNQRAQEALFQQVEDAVMAAGSSGTISASISVSQAPYDVCSYAPSYLRTQRESSIVNSHLAPAPPQANYSSDSDTEVAAGLEMLRTAEENDTRRQSSRSPLHSEPAQDTHRRESSVERTAEEWRRLQAEEMQDAKVDDFAFKPTGNHIPRGKLKPTDDSNFNMQCGMKTTLNAQDSMQASDTGGKTSNTPTTDIPFEVAHDVSEDEKWAFSPDDIGRLLVQHHGSDSDDDFSNDTDSSESETISGGKTDAVDHLLRNWTTLDI